MLGRHGDMTVSNFNNSLLLDWMCLNQCSHCKVELVVGDMTVSNGNYC